MIELNSNSTNCQLWVLNENPNDYWWQQVDFNCGFLLSEVFHHNKKTISSNITHIADEVSLPLKNHNFDKPWSLIGCQNHINADWIFLIHDLSKFDFSELDKIVQDLQIKSIRHFAPIELPTSLKARLEHCDYVSSSKNI